MQQNNGADVDRRYTYFQHASTFGRKLNLFSSFELDLFNPQSGKARLTNLYFSSKYRFSRNLDVFVSYDSRRRIIYYDTYRSDVEMLLDDDEARQGARIRLTYKPFKHVVTGLSFSERFQSSGMNPSENINGFVTFSGQEDEWGRWTVQVNRNTSSFLRSEIASIRHARTFNPPETQRRRLLPSGQLRVRNFQRRRLALGVASTVLRGRPFLEHLPFAPIHAPRRDVDRRHRAELSVQYLHHQALRRPQMIDPGRSFGV